MADLNKMTDWSKLREMVEDSKLESKSHTVDEAQLLAHLKGRIKGQDEILVDVARLIRLSWEKHERTRPICSLLLLGPTGTGKTELAKALTEFLYGNEKDMLRFDCSELSSPDMAKARLTGSSVGFVGSESGGQLTRPMMANPRRLVLFDEIEKAHSLVFDLLLQVMGDGRLTEQSTGKTADFTQAIIVLTSNAIADEVAKAIKGMTDYHEILNAIKELLAESKVFRPEILGRIDKVYMFKPLQGMVIAEIALLKIARLAQEYGMTVEFVAPELLMQALEANLKVSKFGIRELERILFDFFAPALVEMRDKKAKVVAFEAGPDGRIVCSDRTPKPPAAQGQSQQPAGADAMQLTDADFEAEVMKSAIPVLVDFWAPWCGPCRMMGPIIHELAVEYAGKVKVCKLNIDENRQTAARFKVTSIPALLFFKGGACVKQMVGVQQKPELRPLLDGLL